MLGGRDSAGPAPQGPNAKKPVSWDGRRFHAVVERCHDGDTCRVALPGLPDVFATMGVRLRGIDAAELRGAQCPLEKCLALDARDALIKMVVGRNATLDSCAPDKYFRLLCDVSVDGEDVGGKLLRGGYAVPYNGRGPKHAGARPPASGRGGARRRSGSGKVAFVC